MGQEKKNMLEHIIFTAMVIIAAAAGIWIWWREYHGSLADGAEKSFGAADQKKENSEVSL